MPVEVFCPRCTGGFQTEPSHLRREYPCPRCDATIVVSADPDCPPPPPPSVLDRLLHPGAAARPAPLAPIGESATGWGPPKSVDWVKPQNPEDASWLAVAVQLAAVIAVVVAVAWVAGGGPDGPGDDLFAALDEELAGLVAELEGVRSLDDSEAALPQLNRRVAAFNRLLEEPRPFGLTRREVAPSAWFDHGEEFKDRLKQVRAEQSRIIGISGAGREVAYALSQLPQTDKQLRAKLMETPRNFDREPAAPARPADPATAGDPAGP